MIGPPGRYLVLYGPLVGSVLVVTAPANFILDKTPVILDIVASCLRSPI